MSVLDFLSVGEKIRHHDINSIPDQPVIQIKKIEPGSHGYSISICGRHGAVADQFSIDKQGNSWSGVVWVCLAGHWWSLPFLMQNQQLAASLLRAEEIIRNCRQLRRGSVRMVQYRPNDSNKTVLIEGKGPHVRDLTTATDIIVTNNDTRQRIRVSDNGMTGGNLGIEKMDGDTPYPVDLPVFLLHRTFRHTRLDPDPTRLSYLV